MRTVSGTLEFAYTPNESVILLQGHRDAYLFDRGMHFEEVIDAGTPVILTLITLAGPNPANLSMLAFEVERIVAIKVGRQPAGIERTGLRPEPA